MPDGRSARAACCCWVIWLSWWTQTSPYCSGDSPGSIRRTCGSVAVPERIRPWATRPRTAARISTRKYCGSSLVVVVTTAIRDWASVVGGLVTDDPRSAAPSLVSAASAADSRSCGSAPSRRRRGRAGDLPGQRLTHRRAAMSHAGLCAATPATRRRRAGLTCRGERCGVVADPLGGRDDLSGHRHLRRARQGSETRSGVGGVPGRQSQREAEHRLAFGPARLVQSGNLQQPVEGSRGTGLG